MTRRARTNQRNTGVRACLLGVLTVSASLAQTWIAQASGTRASLRGVSAASRSVVWASGAKGACLRTLDGGATWSAAAVPDAAALDFRGIHALDGRTAWLMSSGPGAGSRIFHTTDGGAHWSLLFTNPDAAGFFDAIAFRDARHGFVLGDPVGGQFVVLATADAGRTWRRRKLPPALPDEGAFAASNSCLVLRGAHEIWFGTGGPTGARVFHSSDDGERWSVAATPLGRASAGAGIFSLAFADSLDGIAVGGDYARPADAAANLAITSDGGRTWAEPRGSGPHGYRSAVAYLAGRRLWIAVGTSGSDMSRNGAHWKLFDGAAYNALSAAGDAVWAVGPDGRIAKLRYAR